MSYSTVLIIPADLREKANAVGEALGHGPSSYTLPLTLDGETVTHWGAHTHATDDFFLTVISAAQGHPPDVDWSVFGLSVADVGLVLGAVFISAPGSLLDDAMGVNVNRAPAEILETLPHVGPSTAAHIISGRPWLELADLARIPGLTLENIESWDDDVTVGRLPETSPSRHFSNVLERFGLAPLSMEVEDGA